MTGLTHPLEAAYRLHVQRTVVRVHAEAAKAGRSLCAHHRAFPKCLAPCAEAAEIVERLIAERAGWNEFRERSRDE